MVYEAINFDNLLGTSGFSDNLLQNHFKLYDGYVTNTNKLLDILKKLLDEGKTGTPEYAELKRRFGWEFNGMRLHELYFGNMTNEKTGLSKSSKLYKKMTETFGSSQKCEDDFKAVGALRGIGWAVMAYDLVGDNLFNVWINEHDVGHLAGGVPLLVMDVFEHAFVLDYGMNRADYIKAFVKATNWDVVEKRFDKVKG